MLANILVVLMLMLTGPQQCNYSSDCGQDECRVWENGRFVCEPAQTSVMVWDAACIDKIEKGLETKMEAPMVDGVPDMKQAKLTGVHATYSPKCGHIEIRHR